MKWLELKKSIHSHYLWFSLGGDKMNKQEEKDGQQLKSVDAIQRDCEGF